VCSIQIRTVAHLARQGRHASLNRKPERGTAVVEFALVLVFLLLLLAGVVDYSFTLQAKRNLSDAARSAARSGVQACIGNSSCTAGNPGNADATALGSIRSTLGAEASRVTRVIIFRSASANTEVPPSCLASTSGGVDGLCNVIERPFDTTAPTIPTKWVVGTRNRNNASADYLGVYVEATNKRVFGLAGPGATLFSQASFRLEPPVTQASNLQPLPTFPQNPPDWVWDPYADDGSDDGDSGTYVPPNAQNGTA
jgi:hypothetical protein